jgi:hypothetical protein
MRHNAKYFQKIFMKILLLLIISYFPNVSSANTLDIYVKASQENMNNGKFDVEFHEIVTTGTVREFSFTSHGYIEKYMTAFVKSNAGTATIDVSSQKIKFEFTNSGTVVYGYTITPAANTNGSGYCNKDIGIFDLYANFPGNIMYENTFTEINLTYDIPGAMELYTPWNDDINNQIKLKTNSMTKEIYFVTAWGNFTKVEKHKYGTHTFYMLGYGTDTTNNFKITKITYDYFMQAFADNYDFLAPANLYIVLPENEGCFHPLGEGFGGSYMHNEVGSTWNPIFSATPAQCGVYLQWTQNGNDLTVAPVHHIAHATLNRFISDWWPVEGIAVYYQIFMLYKAGILTSQEMKKEFSAHLACYQNGIVGSKDDYALKDYKAFKDGWYVTIMTAYIKGALVYYAINEIIQESSNGQLELIDFFTYLFKNITTATTYDQFISLLNSFTGKDFTDFFNKYVYSNEPLPLDILGDDVLLTYIPPDYTVPPSLTITTNGSHQLSITAGTQIPIKISSKIAPSSVNQKADWWVVADTPFGWYSYVNNAGWQTGINPFKQDVISDFSMNVLNNVTLPAGNYNFYFALDDNMDGNPDATWYDAVSIHVFELNFNFPFSIPKASITVDGKKNDWNGIAPVLSDSKGDSICESGTDIKDIYFAKDGQYLYWRMDTWSGQFASQGVSFGKGPTFAFYVQKSDGTLTNQISSQMLGGATKTGVGMKDDLGKWTSYGTGLEYGQILDVAEGKIPLFLFKGKVYSHYFLGYHGGENNFICDEVQ